MARRALASLAAGALLLGACGDDDATDADAAIEEATTTTTTASEGGETGSAPTAIYAERIVGEFHAVEPGRRLIDTLGIPLALELTGEWQVQPNRAGFTVLTHPDSTGPQDRDVVFIRPTGLAEPDRLNDSPEGFRSQDGWPLSDIDGWLQRVPPGLVDGDPVDTSLGGRDAVRFDVAPADDFPCGPQVCAGFVTNKWVDSTHFEPGKRRTVWWVDGGGHEPLVVLVGRNADNTEWLATAEALLDTVELGEPGPHPIGDRSPVELGLPGEVSAGDTVQTPRLGGLRFVVSADRFIYQAPGLVDLSQPAVPGAIDLVHVVETLEGEPIDSVDTVVGLIDEASRTFEEIAPTIIAGYDARVFDFTAEKEGEPRPDDAVFRFEQGGVGGWGPIGAGRVWLLDTPRGVLLFSAGISERRDADLSQVVAEAETIFATLELVEVAS